VKTSVQHQKLRLGHHHARIGALLLPNSGELLRGVVVRGMHLSVIRQRLQRNVHQLYEPVKGVRTARTMFKLSHRAAALQPSKSIRPKEPMNRVSPVSTRCGLGWSQNTQERKNCRRQTYAKVSSNRHWEPKPGESTADADRERNSKRERERERPPTRTVAWRVQHANAQLAHLEALVVLCNGHTLLGQVGLLGDGFPLLLMNVCLARKVKWLRGYEGEGSYHCGWTQLVHQFLHAWQYAR
jgi:hypothetical protein